MNHWSFVVIRHREWVLLWRLCPKEHPERIGLVDVPSAPGLPEEQPFDTAVRALQVDACFEPDPKRLTPRLQCDGWDPVAKEKYLLHFFEYSWLESPDTFPPFVPTAIVDRRGWTSCGDKFPEFNGILLECAVHYIMQSWRYPHSS